jgi:hypothetical protein
MLLIVIYANSPGLQILSLPQYWHKSRDASPLPNPIPRNLQRIKAKVMLSTLVKHHAESPPETPHQSLSTIKPSPQHFIVPFAPNPQFYGRNSELTLLDELLTASDDTEKSTYPIVAIYGLGGIGYVRAFVRSLQF